MPVKAYKWLAQSGSEGPHWIGRSSLHRFIRRPTIWVALALLWLPGSGRATEAPARHTSPPGALTVVSLNLALREDVDRIASELAATGIGEAADVLLLQEVARREPGPDVATQLGERLGLDSLYQEAFAVDDERSSGLALLSRYPQRDPRVLALRPFNLAFRSRSRIALGAALDTPAGPVHVFNVHLDTRLNIKPRLEQLVSVARDVTSLAGPAIVGGDFNTNDNRWLFHTIPLPFFARQGAGLLRFMEGHGFRSAFARGMPTHDALGMQLDWVFLRGLQASTGSIQPVQVSDHHALIVSVVPSD
jgi:endonuclease/exonuclease/phosphatase family metal-dependent hydrolase